MLGSTEGNTAGEAAGALQALSLHNKDGCDAIRNGGGVFQSDLAVDLAVAQPPRTSAVRRPARALAAAPFHREG